MSKKDIAAILTKGSAKQRCLLIAEQIARLKFSLEPLLSDHEFNSLMDSIKKPQEIKVYNQFKNADKGVSNALYILNQLRISYREQIANLRGYMLLWESYQRAEEIANLILHEIKDPEERKRITAKALKLQPGEYGSPFMMFAKLLVDKEGYLCIDPTKRRGNSLLGESEHTLMKAIEGVRENATALAVRCISYAEATTDYMEEVGFKVKTYLTKINEVLEDVRSDKAIYEKYAGKDGNKRRKNTRRNKVDSLYAIYPDTTQLEVDQEYYREFKEDLENYG